MILQLEIGDFSVKSQAAAVQSACARSVLETNGDERNRNYK